MQTNFHTVGRLSIVEIKIFHSYHMPQSYLITLIYSSKNTKISPINYFGPPWIFLIPLAHKYFISHYLNWVMIYTITKKSKKTHILSNFINIILLSLKPALRAQCTHPIYFFKNTQGYLCLTILQKSNSH